MIWVEHGGEEAEVGVRNGEGQGGEGSRRLERRERESFGSWL